MIHITAGTTVWAELLYKNNAEQAVFIIPYLNGEESTWHLQHRCIVEVAGEEFDVDGGRHKN